MRRWLPCPFGTGACGRARSCRRPLGRRLFVIETRGFNDRTPLDAIGHPRSESMHVTERFHRPDYGHLDIEMTFDDPEMYTAKFTVKVAYELVPDNDIFEMYCGENEKDRAHMVK